MKYATSRQFGFFARFTPPLSRWSARIARRVLHDAWQCLSGDNDILFSPHYLEYAPWSTARCRGFSELEIDVIQTRESYKAFQKNGVKRPVLFYLHGGGFVYDASKAQYRLAARYAKETGCVVVFPRYRLAPVSEHPAQMADSRAAFLWLRDHAEELGVKLDSLVVGGDSAGGFLALHTARWAAEKGYPVLAQFLVYPVVDPQLRTASMKRFTRTPVWNARLNKKMWTWFFKDAKHIHPAARLEWSILDAFDVTATPQTYIETAEYDCLHDEAALYAEKLKAAGVPVTENHTKETMHGFDHIPCPLTARALDSRLTFLKKTFNHVPVRES